MSPAVPAGAGVGNADGDADRSIQLGVGAIGQIVQALFDAVQPLVRKCFAQLPVLFFQPGEIGCRLACTGRRGTSDTGANRRLR